MFIQALKNLFNINKAQFSTSQFFGMGQAKHMGRTAIAFGREGYSQNVICFRCTQVIAEAIAEIPVVVYKGDKPDPNHPLQKLIDNPNPSQGWDQYVTELVAFRLITGNSFTDVNRGISGGLPLQLQNWQPYQFKVVKPNIISPIPHAYVWESGKIKAIWDVDPVTGQSDLYHWKSFHPFDPYFGMSPIEAAAYSVDQHNAASEWNLRLLQNDASPSGVLSTEGALTEEQYQRLKLDMEQNWGGSQNAKKPLLLEAGLTWQQLSMSPKDLDWIKGFNLSAQNIAAAYGVPLQVIPIPGSQTFANYAEARLSLYEDTAIPLGNNLLQELMKWLRPYYPDGEVLSLRFNLDEVSALSSRRKEKWDTVNSSTILTTNEKRVELGFEEYVPGDENPANQILIASGDISIDDLGMDPDAGIEEDPDSEENEDDDEGDGTADDSDDNTDNEENDGDEKDKARRLSLLTKLKSRTAKKEEIKK